MPDLGLVSSMPCALSFINYLNMTHNFFIHNRVYNGRAHTQKRVLGLSTALLMVPLQRLRNGLAAPQTHVPWEILPALVVGKLTVGSGM